MQTALTEYEAMVYPWTLRWLRGHEYLQIIKNYEKYCQTMNFELLEDHPSWIYHTPSNGKIYFLNKVVNLQKLGFPRVKAFKKKYKWRKMNFLTNLPKNKPLITYIVATARYNSNCFRMHIVLPYDLKKYPNSVILCHMLEVAASDDEIKSNRKKKSERPIRQLNPFPSIFNVFNRNILKKVETKTEENEAFLDEKTQDYSQSNHFQTNKVETFEVKKEEIVDRDMNFNEYFEFKEWQNTGLLKCFY